MTALLDRPASFCVVCDAAPGACDHRGLRYHDPLPYRPVTLHGRQVGWQLPRWHGQELDEARLKTQLRELDRRYDARPKPDPSVCSSCGDALATFQIVNGFTRCSSCYRKAQPHG